MTTAVERILTTLGLGETDRPPVMPVMLMQGAKALGTDLLSYFETPDRIASGQLGLIETFGHDAVYAFPHIVQDVLPWGAGLDFHPDGPPSVNGMVISSKEDIPNLVVPDPTSHPYLKATLRSAEQLAREVKGDRLIVGALIGPFSLPTMLMGTSKFLDLLLMPESERKQWFDPLMEKMLEYTLSWGRAQIAAGCDAIVLAEGTSSASIIDPELFRSCSHPVLRRFIEEIGAPVGFEFVGRAMPMLDAASDLGPALWLLGEEDPLGEARRILGRKGAIMGSVNNLKLMRWEPERVEFEARRLINEAGPGFILSNQGPEVPWDTPDENIKALIRAASRS